MPCRRQACHCGQADMFGINESASMATKPLRPVAGFSLRLVGDDVRSLTLNVAPKSQSETRHLVSCGRNPLGDRCVLCVRPRSIRNLKVTTTGARLWRRPAAAGASAGAGCGWCSAHARAPTGPRRALWSAASSRRFREATGRRRGGMGLEIVGGFRLARAGAAWAKGRASDLDGGKPLPAGIGLKYPAKRGKRPENPVKTAGSRHDLPDLA